MITNLFSRFDPSSGIFRLPLNWVSCFLGLLFIPFSFWRIPSRWLFIWATLLSSLHKEFKTLLGPTNTGGSLFFSSLFRFIIFNNSLGLLPYVFTGTSHLAVTLRLALPIWLSFIAFGWLNNTNHIFAHLVPLGTPKALIPFMVLIETIRNLIRPAALSVRLSANIIAGHLLLTLLGNIGPYLQDLSLKMLLNAQILLMLLESAVAIIQAYVFAVLILLYAREVN